MLTRMDDRYTYFVDFKKAFDSVWHDGLYLKLLKNKISGNFYKLMKNLNLYSNSKCAVKQSNHRTSFFPYRVSQKTRKLLK